MMSEAEKKIAKEMLSLARQLASSEGVFVQRAGERATAIFVDLLYEDDPWAGLGEFAPTRISS